VNSYINVFDDIYIYIYIYIYIKFVIFVQYGIVVVFFFLNYVVVNEFEEISRMVGPRL
jgi:hypothetical protein